MTSIRLQLAGESSLIGSAHFNVACSNVFNTGLSNDWTMHNVSATTSLSIVQNKACSLTFLDYFDGVTSLCPR